MVSLAIAAVVLCFCIGTAEHAYEAWKTHRGKL
jgi:hypothetical protein